MANWATYVVVPEDGGDGSHEVYEARFGAVGLDLDLLAGPDVVVPLLRARSQVPGRWRDDGCCEAAVLIDLRRRTLLLFAWEGPITQMRHRAAMWEVLHRAWPGWELRWTYDGPAELATCLGLDPEEVRYRHPSLCLELALDLGDEELVERDPLVRVVTIGADRCHLLSAVNDHPIAEGPALLDRLADAPAHGRCAVAADSGIHVDPARRRVGWWLLSAVAGAGEMASRWPGWTVEFWQDRWEEHVRVAGGRFVPPTVDRVQALAELRNEAEEHWSPRPPSGWVGWVQAAAPDSACRTVTATVRGAESRNR
ncbi:hypothetical protein ACFV9D_31840 [Streptomyces sp. NPDC059875]|uniref:hypothetical protein n=1 Tax=unclassified Streptomyces TaxID=2593676 RepID=UPI00366508BA